MEYLVAIFVGNTGPAVGEQHVHGSFSSPLDVHKQSSLILGRPFFEPVQTVVEQIEKDFL